MTGLSCSTYLLRTAHAALLITARRTCPTGRSTSTCAACRTESFRAHDASAPRARTSPGPACTIGRAVRRSLPTPDLEEHRPHRHRVASAEYFRPRRLEVTDADEEVFRTWILGPVFHDEPHAPQRGHLSHINAIGELCARSVKARSHDAPAAPDAVIARVEAYHRLHPRPRSGNADALSAMESGVAANRERRARRHGGRDDRPRA